jgi:hypothetical protein
MNKTTIGIILFCSGLTFGSAEPVTWNLPVGLLMAAVGGWLMAIDARREIARK